MAGNSNGGDFNNFSKELTSIFLKFADAQDIQNQNSMTAKEINSVMSDLRSFMKNLTTKNSLGKSEVREISELKKGLQDLRKGGNATGDATAKELRDFFRKFGRGIDGGKASVSYLPFQAKVLHELESGFKSTKDSLGAGMSKSFGSTSPFAVMLNKMLGGKGKVGSEGASERKARQNTFIKDLVTKLESSRLVKGLSTDILRLGSFMLANLVSKIPVIGKYLGPAFLLMGEMIAPILAGAITSAISGAIAGKVAGGVASKAISAGTGAVIGGTLVATTTQAASGAIAETAGAGATVATQNAVARIAAAKVAGEATRAASIGARAAGGVAGGTAQVAGGVATRVPVLLAAMLSLGQAFASFSDFQKKDYKRAAGGALASGGFLTAALAVPIAALLGVSIPIVAGVGLIAGTIGLIFKALGDHFKWFKDKEESKDEKDDGGRAKALEALRASLSSQKSATNKRLGESTYGRGGLNIAGFNDEGTRTAISGSSTASGGPSEVFTGKGGFNNDVNSRKGLVYGRNYTKPELEKMLKNNSAYEALSSKSFGKNITLDKGSFSTDVPYLRKGASAGFATALGAIGARGAVTSAQGSKGAYVGGVWYDTPHKGEGHFTGRAIDIDAGSASANASLAKRAQASGYFETVLDEKDHVHLLLKEKFVAQAKQIEDALKTTTDKSKDIMKKGMSSTTKLDITPLSTSILKGNTATNDIVLAGMYYNNNGLK